ncbi:HvfA family oxazolone/thioamide-modified RiPP metallophore [Pseudomonas neustonica]|jgi:uncharacterized low-complexity protein|uniref:Low-complexity protein n=1 Tax=Pseudomonas neustonica TaxID=2487346 RepID=A0ABX9XHN3_9PSED|nr:MULTISPECIES: hypothetical protein [Pseudomonas]MBA6419541.1 hypothetical protein [Pseudomonas sp. 5Ae-yellow]ROZ82526.1 hypothetical protein EF096_14870 [Pseudomonas neustonica]ROZ82597.1 hypothetical protein EF099_11675 [Pseudomonas sp. SSM44]|tara:strand:+ start:753 stop:995 length:243 start_codon:yes stop_codon:yes gene_type:complete
MNKFNTAMLTLGVTLVSAGVSVNAAENPFAVQELQSGYNVADNHGEGDMEGKCGEGSCGEEKEESKSEAEGKCGEGTCGN